MGLFLSSIEDKLKNLYTKMLIDMGMPDSEANSSVIEMIEKGKKIIKELGEDKLPDNMEDKILKEPGFKIQLHKTKKEGVKNEDMKWWWDMHPLERQMMIQMDDFNKMALVLSLLDRGETMEKATKTVEKYHPIFGDYTSESKFSGENRPLPFELKDRINIYIEKRAKESDEKYKEDIEKFSSFNALVRKEIKNENL